MYLRHLEAWTDKYFETFWRNCYRQRVAECGRRYNRLREKKGKAPTPKQFATQDVVTTINQYFGGDYTRLLEALGEPVPKGASIREGNLIVSLSTLEETLREMARRQMIEDDGKLQDVLVRLGIRYCILWEGRGKPPTRSAFSSSYYYQEICQRLRTDASKNPRRPGMRSRPLLNGPSNRFSVWMKNLVILHALLASRRSAPPSFRQYPTSAPVCIERWPPADHPTLVERATCLRPPDSREAHRIPFIHSVAKAGINSMSSRTTLCHFSAFLAWRR